jgi:hypothetical protein
MKAISHAAPAPSLLSQGSPRLRSSPSSTPSLRPSSPARSPALLLLGFLLVTALGALIELPVTVTGGFTVVPVRGSDPLRAPRAGIITEVAAVEGKRVTRGDLLFLLRSELAGDRAGEVETLDITIRGAEERLRNERARARSQADADREGQRGVCSSRRARSPARSRWPRSASPWERRSSRTTIASSPSGSPASRTCRSTCWT